MPGPLNFPKRWSMPGRSERWIWFCGLALFLGRPSQVLAEKNPGQFKGVLVTAALATDARLREFKREGYQAAVLNLATENEGGDDAAARRIHTAGLELYYWIEIAHSPSLADAHPEWMASIQTHPEWRRLFPGLPPLKTNEVVKTYPWVPIGYEETFPVHLAGVRQLLSRVPAPEGIFLNDLQAGPSACGCGNHLCRWTSDYGPITTATRLGSDAAARFVAEVRKLAPGARVMPVWTTECEEQDAKDLCAGVGCFKGACWREFTAQLTPLTKEADLIGALLPYKDFQRDLPRYGAPAGWITQAIGSFSQMPLRYGPSPLSSNRIIAVLQGWDVTPEQIKAQISRSEEAGAAGYVVSLTKLDQSWQPRIFDTVGLGLAGKGK
jgi:hypothetical protein